MNDSRIDKIEFARMTWETELDKSSTGCSFRAALLTVEGTDFATFIGAVFDKAFTNL